MFTLQNKQVLKKVLVQYIPNTLQNTHEILICMHRLLLWAVSTVKKGVLKMYPLCRTLYKKLYVKFFREKINKITKKNTHRSVPYGADTCGLDMD